LQTNLSIELIQGLNVATIIESVGQGRGVGLMLENWREAAAKRISWLGGPEGTGMLVIREALETNTCNRLGSLLN
jgi:hypothetical protein